MPNMLPNLGLGEGETEIEESLVFSTKGGNLLIRPKKYGAAHIASKALFQQMSVEEKSKVSVRFTAMFILVSYQ